MREAPVSDGDAWATAGWKSVSHLSSAGQLALTCVAAEVVVEETDT